jgi:hypothetical protein
VIPFRQATYVERNTRKHTNIMVGSTIHSTCWRNSPVSSAELMYISSECPQEPCSGKQQKIEN